MDNYQTNDIHWATNGDNEVGETIADVMDFATGEAGEDGPSQEDLTALQDLMDKIVDFSGCESEAARHGFEFVKNGFVPVEYESDDWT